MIIKQYFTMFKGLQRFFFIIFCLEYFQVVFNEETSLKTLVLISFLLSFFSFCFLELEWNSTLVVSIRDTCLSNFLFENGNPNFLANSAHSIIDTGLFFSISMEKENVHFVKIVSSLRGQSSKCKEIMHMVLL